MPIIVKDSSNGQNKEFAIRDIDQMRREQDLSKVIRIPQALVDEMAELGLEKHLGRELLRIFREWAILRKMALDSMEELGIADVVPVDFYQALVPQWLDDRRALDDAVLRLREVAMLVRGYQNDQH